MEKGENGQPQPSNGVFWSISHKGEYVAGLVSKSPAGIDLEKIKDISRSLFKKIVGQKEKQCFEKEDSNITFFRCFTAKEAVLKVEGVGLIGLSHISVIKVEDSLNMLLRYKNKEYKKEYKVEHIFFDKYIASVVKDDSKVEWRID